ncbi:MAG: DUF58 domain-containing protein [Acidimicrobiales bacterium]
MAVGLTVGVLAAFVAAAGWRLGATNRGLICLAIAAALGIGGRLAGVEEYVLVAVALGVLLASGPIVLWHRAEIASGALQIELRPSSHEVSVGGSASVAVSVTNTGMRTCAPMRLEPPNEVWKLSRPGLRSRVSDVDTSVPRGPKKHRSRGWRTMVSRGVRVPALGPGESAEMSFPVPSAKRGVLTLPALKLWCLDPFELFAYEMLISTETSIVVVPDASSPRGVVTGALQPAGRFEWSPPASGESSGGPGFDLAGLRPYVPGDRLRLLHWPTLARTGELIVREFEGSGTDAVTIIMDDRAGAVDASGFEAIVSATAGIGKDAARRGLGVELRTPSGVSVDLHSGPTLTRSLFRILATLDPVKVKPGRAKTSSYGFASTHLMEDHGGEKHRIVISTQDAVNTLPEILKRSSTVVVV